MSFVPLVFGAVFILIAIADLDMIMDSEKTELIRRIIGRMGLRICFGVIGAAVFIIGVLGLIGVIEFNK
jgi:hypothetical protein